MVDTFYLLFQVDPANIEGLKSRLEQKDKEICALKQAAKVGYSRVLIFILIFWAALKYCVLKEGKRQPK